MDMFNPFVGFDDMDWLVFITVSTTWVMFTQILFGLGVNHTIKIFLTIFGVLLLGVYCFLKEKLARVKEGDSK